MKRIWLIVLVVTSSPVILMTARAFLAAQPIEIDLTQWAQPDIAAVGDDPFGELVKYGHALFVDTTHEIGPAVSDPKLLCWQQSGVPELPLTSRHSAVCHAADRHLGAISAVSRERGRGRHARRSD